MSPGSSGPIEVSELDGGVFWRVALARPKANVIDAEMTAALCHVFAEAASSSRLAGILLCAEGPHFSFGASVREHLPEHVGAMLTAFHGLFRTIAAARIPVVASVRGQCLGGGLELASFCHRVVVAPDARMGQPEIRLGVIAPVASALLPERVGHAIAADLCLSGRTVTAQEALVCGLADQIAEDPEIAAGTWMRESLSSHSAMSLRFATRALRSSLESRFFATLNDLEHLYLEDLMRTEDAVEGIQAFLDKRQPLWRHQ